MPRKTNTALQEKLAAVKRDQILDAARAVFAEKGFHRATIKDVAARAGVADGTVYNYFENKTALILGLLDWVNQTDQREADLEAAKHMNLETFVQQYVHERFDFLMGAGLNLFQAFLPEILSNEELRALYRAKIMNPTYDAADRALLPVLQSGGVKPEDARLKLRLVTAMFLGLIVLRIIGDDLLEENVARLPDAAAEAMLRLLQSKETPS